MTTPTSEPMLTMAKPVGPTCNLACGYCYYLEKASLFPTGERLLMRPEVLEAYIASTIAASPGPVVPFVWHGGEPTLAGLDFYRQVVQLQTRHLPEGWFVLNNLQTNATRLDGQWCAFLAAHRFSVGVSLDGPPHLHDLGRKGPRGSPTSQRALAGLRLLRDHGIEPDVLCALHADNVGHPLDVYHFFLDADVRWLQFLPVVRRTARGELDPWSVPPDGPGAFLSAVFDEWVRFDVDRIGIQNFLECLLVLRGGPANLCVMAETCGRVLAVEHDGGVYSCDHFVDAGHRLGNVLTDELDALVDGPAQAAFGRAKRDGLPARCRDCPVGFLCHGGCPKDRFAIGEGGEERLNYLCPSYRRFYEHARVLLGRMVTLARLGRSPRDVMAELEVAERDARRAWREASRNAPCPCGSGQKYKHCCFGRRRR